MANINSVVVVVDPYSSGRYLTEELKSQNVLMVAVQSSLDMADFWLEQLEKDDFVECIVHKDQQSTVERLKKYHVRAVTPGSEPGVLLAEELGHVLGLEKMNSAATSEWRRHKYCMQERCREMGIRAVRQIYAKSAEEAYNWQQVENKQQWPIIVKPAMSGGTDGVFWCHSFEDVQAAFESECGKVNVNGTLNDCLLAQEFLDGTEYIVDCVSNEGNHVLSGIWEYKKIYSTEERSITYEFAEIIPSVCPERPYAKDSKQELLIEYMFRVLDALQIKFGASHGEVIMCKDGPCLVEVGARMHGLKGPFMTQMATGFGIHELVADVLINGGRLHTELLNRNFRYPIKKFAQEAMLNNMDSKKEGALATDIDPEGKILKLPSCIAFYPSLKKGDEIKKTRDLATAPGAFMLLHSRREQILEDMQKVREWEAGKLYNIAAPDNKSLPASPPVSSVDLLSCSTKPDKRVSPYCLSPAGQMAGQMKSKEDAFDSNRHSLQLLGLDDEVEEPEPREEEGLVNYSNLKQESGLSLLSMKSEARLSGA